jgi:NodT family efflux transporter outer membrane factor (OMF) lipoprotein
MWITISFTACSLFGPEYKKPTIDTPANWNNESMPENKVKISGENISDTAWWTKFNDPVLNQLIIDALAHNNNLQMAIGNIMAAKADLEKSKMAWVPTVNLGGAGLVGQGFNQSLSSNNPGFSNFNPGSNNIYGAFGGFMPVYSFNILQNLKATDIAKLNLSMERVAKNAVRLSIISQVSGAYFTLLGLQQRLQLQQQLLITANKLRAYTKIKVTNGISTEVDIAMVDQLIAELATSIPNIKNNITQTQNALLLLTNKNPGKIVLKNDFTHLKTTGIIPINLPSSVLKNRPDVLLAEYQLQISNARIGLNMAKFFPTISLTSPVGASSFQLSNLFSGSNDFWMTQLAATVPILDLGIYSDIKKARADYYSAYYNYIRVVRAAFADVDNNLSKYSAVNSIVKLRAEELNAATKLHYESISRYNAGVISYADTLNFELNAINVQIEVNQAQMNQLNEIVDLYQAFAGGYNVKNNEVSKKFHDAHDI